MAFLLMKLINFLRKLCWRIFKPSTLGVRLLCLNNDKVLLVKHSYLNQWYLPGGQVKAKETAEEALKREIKEELNIDIIEKPKIFGLYFSSQEYKRDHIVVFVIERLEADHNKVAPKSIEIEETGYFPVNDLPENVSPATKRRIMEFLEQKVGEKYLKSW